MRCPGEDAVPQAAQIDPIAAGDRYRHIQVRPTDTGFGAEVTGVALDRPLPGPVRDEVMQAWARHAVLAFPDQPLTHAQLEAFTLQIGPFGEDPYVKPMPGHPNILEVRREPDEKSRTFGQAWHSDWSFLDTPPAATLLHSKVTPPVGGDTLYADGYRAYESLSPTLRRVLDGLRAVHSARRSYGPQGTFATDPEKRAMDIITGESAEAARSHPLVRVHPLSGRRALYVNPVYTIGIEGMTEPESKALLDFLFARMLEDRFIYRHRWRQHMLTLWDNRCTMHFADGGYDGHLRVMHRTTVAGEAPMAVP
jgi:taurine dioxygenase